MKKKWYKKYPLPPIFQISSPGLAEIFFNCFSRACFMYKISQLYMLLQAARPLTLKNKFKPIQYDLKYLVGEENSLSLFATFLVNWRF